MAPNLYNDEEGQAPEQEEPVLSDNDGNEEEENENGNDNEEEENDNKSDNEEPASVAAAEQRFPLGDRTDPQLPQPRPGAAQDNYEAVDRLGAEAAFCTLFPMVQEAAQGGVEVLRKWKGAQEVGEVEGEDRVLSWLDFLPS